MNANHFIFIINEIGFKNHPSVNVCLPPGGLCTFTEVF